METYAFYDSLTFESEFRDEFGNRLNNVEVDIHYKSERTLTLGVSIPNTKVNLTFGKV